MTSRGAIPQGPRQRRAFGIITLNERDEGR
jgi:hypothetical protein